MATTQLDPDNFVDRMRLLTGDFIEDEPYLEDSIYVYFYGKNGNSEIDGAIEALESIINNIALSPVRWQIGDASETNASVAALQARLADLRVRKKGNKVPVLVHTDRSNWQDFDKVFGKQC